MLFEILMNANEFIEYILREYAARALPQSDESLTCSTARNLIQQ